MENTGADIVLENEKTAEQFNAGPISHGENGAETTGLADSMWAVALFDFIPQFDEEMCLYAGEYVIVEDTESLTSSGWWKGRSKDGTRQGMFPKDYVGETQPPEEDEDRIDNLNRHDADNNDMLQDHESVDDSENEEDLRTSLSLAIEGPNKRTGEGAQYVKLNYDFNPSSADELALKKGDIVLVTPSNEEGWWSGTIDGNSGVFPMNYCVEISANAARKALKSITGQGEATDQNFALEEGVASSAFSFVQHDEALDSKQSMSFTQESKNFTFGRHALWRHPGYVGMCSDRFINGSWPVGLHQEFSSLRQSLNMFCTVLGRLEAKFSDDAVVKRLNVAMSHAFWIAQNLPIDSKDWGNHFLAFLSNFVLRIRDMKNDDVMAIPGGWIFDSSTESTDTQVDDDSSDDESQRKSVRSRGRAPPPPARPKAVESHVIFMVLKRHAKSFSLSIVNTGNPKAAKDMQSVPTNDSESRGPIRSDGLDYHCSVFDQETGKMQRCHSISIDDIPAWRLRDSSFWFFFFRMKILARKSHQPAMLYETLLPYLNRRGFFGNREAKDVSEMDFRTSRNTTDGSFFHLLKATMRACVLKSGGTKPQAKHLSLQFRHVVMDLLKTDLELLNSIEHDEAILIRLGLKQLACNARKCDFMGSSCVTTVSQLNDSMKLIENVEEKLEKLEDAPQRRIQFDEIGKKEIEWAACFPLFGSFRRDVSVESLAGDSPVQPICRHVDLTAVHEKVKSFEEVAMALRACVEACTILDNQRSMTRNSYCVRVALIQHLFTHVIPLPLPCDHPDRDSVCFWFSGEMRYETQVNILRLLEQVCRHFVSSSLSMRITRSLDACRIITMGCIVAITDAVIRKIACDMPSQFSLHYDGKAAGPVFPFGFEVSSLLEESGFLLFEDPYLCTARTQVLDYFYALVTTLRPGHTLFCFDQSMTLGVAESTLLNQLCIQLGFPRSADPKAMASYFSGENPALLDYWPEMGFLRDIVFLFKAMLCPTAKSLPELGFWKATDARLFWRVGKVLNANDGQKAASAVFLEVGGFNKATLECSSYKRQYTSDQTKKNSAWSSLLDFVGLRHNRQPRAPPSGANPSRLTGSDIHTEDDVLFVKDLPSFGGRIRASDSEMLIQYLTAPYLRIPLVLQFFADQSRILALADPLAQAVLDACIFEPSTWKCPNPVSEPIAIPPPDRRHLETPVGLLFNEIGLSPKLIMDCLESLLFYAVELDTGKYAAGSSPIILYVLRLVVRVVQYLTFLIEHYDYTHQVKEHDAVLGSGPHAKIRGLLPQILETEIEYLKSSRERIAKRLKCNMLPLVERWCDEALIEHNSQLACILYAHAAYIFLVDLDELSERSVSTVLISHIFVTLNFQFHAEPGNLIADQEKKVKVDDLGPDVDTMNLGISPTEFFALYQRYRGKMLQWLKADTDACNRVMETVVRRFCSSTVTGGDHFSESHLNQTRSWADPDLSGCVGRFMPDTEIKAYSQSLKSADSVTDFEEWMRLVTTQAVDTEINIQTGEFTLKKQPMQLLPKRFIKMNDFKKVFGEDAVKNDGGLQCASVSQTRNRSWMRLVGSRHDLQLWGADTRTKFPRRKDYRPFPTSLDEGESWIKDVLNPHLTTTLAAFDLFLPATDFTTQSFAVLVGYGKAPLLATSPKGTSEAVHKSNAMIPLCVEVCVFRKPSMIQVFKMLESGRRFYRVLVYSSDIVYSFGSHDVQTTIVQNSCDPVVSVGQIPSVMDPPRMSLVITRVLSKDLGPQEYIDSRFMKGLLPDALLEKYGTWLNVNKRTISGYELAKAENNNEASSRLEIELFPYGAEDSSGMCGSNSYAMVKRLTSCQGESEQCHTLLNPLHSPPNSPLKSFLSVLLRLDNLSHILIWSSIDAAKPDCECTVDLIEFPRLNMSFRVDYSLNAVRLWSKEHKGLFISNSNHESIARLTEGLPHAIVMENLEGEFFVALAATAIPSRLKRRNELFATQLLLNRTKAIWNDNLGDVRHYLYPVHLSRAFLFTPTLASTLYLLLIRFISRQYDAVFRLADACVKDTPLTVEEEQLVDLLGNLTSDFHPNAHACRLKLSFVSLGSQDNVRFPWDIVSEMCEYATKRPSVSAVCRLSVFEELNILDEIASQCDGGDLRALHVGEFGLQLHNRRALLNALQMRQQDIGCTTFATDSESLKNLKLVHSAPPRLGPCFVEVRDETALEDRKNANSWRHTLRFFSAMRPMSYDRPDENMFGMSALTLFGKIVDGGVSIRGGKSSKGFPFMYELMTGSLQVRILDTDHAYNWGSMLLHLMPTSRFKKTQTMTSVLRILSNNPGLVESMPKYVDDRKYKLTLVFKGQNVIQRLLEKCNSILRSQAASVSWPPTNPLPSWVLPEALKYPLPESQRRDRHWLVPNAVDMGCTEREFFPQISNLSTDDSLVGFDENEAASFAGTPMESIGLDSFVEIIPTTGLQRSDVPLTKPDGSLLLNVDSHPRAKSQLAIDMLQRMREDARTYQDMMRKKENSQIKDSDCFEQLIVQLEQLYERDQKVVQSTIKHILQLANQDYESPETVEEGRKSLESVCFQFGKYSESEIKIWLEMLLASTLSSCGDKLISTLRPNLSKSVIESIFNLCTGMLLRGSRMAQTQRCLSIARALFDATKNDAKEESTKLQRVALLEELVARRHYVRTSTNDATKFILDPRFLIFEFTYGILLRESQVTLVNDIVKSLRDGKSECHQMIMGAGKTTVVSPLLALLLGDGQSLVVQVVPHSLLEFSRTVMREKFSAIIRKPIYTFHFERFSSVPRSLYRKLLIARSSGVVVCTTPTSLKSFFLKLLEISHSLDSDKYAEVSNYESAPHTLKAFLTDYVKRLNIWGKPRSSDKLSKIAVKSMRDQVQLFVKILALFREGILVLDEVDLLLHPLRSELNWPIGKKVPLDFTKSFIRQKEGIRWLMPFHLFDAFFLDMNGYTMWDYSSSRIATKLLEEISETVKEGCELRLLQKTPHLVLLSEEFYEKKLKPLLARWVMFFLLGKGLRAISEDQANTYIMDGPIGASDVAKYINENLDDDSVKLLNLAHQWVSVLAPFCLGKVNRVKYGLLRSPRDLATTVKNRRLLAVPFVGKDCPSRASEFANPDVVIGLSILAYRYEGLRYSDFLSVLRHLYERLQEGQGSLIKRKASRIFVKWIRASGGRVRGTELEVHRRRLLGVTAEAHQANTQDAEVSENQVFFQHDDICPLHLIDFDNKELIDSLYGILRNCSHAVLYYVHHCIFPETLLHHGLKISASGHELGGSIMFSRRVGFSGTPSTLLPQEMGQCRYEKGSDGKMIEFLTDPFIMGIRFMPQNWSVESLLLSVARARPGYQVLIDSGALVTGMTNIEVARFLLHNGLPNNIEGVVYLNEDDIKMVLTREHRILPLDRAGISAEHRFAFYDQVHTTGMDITHCINARAAITLGKDMTFRDYAQGAFRMRGIGLGQTIDVIVIPEIRMLCDVNKRLCKREKLTFENIKKVVKSEDQLCDDLLRGPEIIPNLHEICEWLVLNSMKSDQTQFKLLCEQSARSVYRKSAHKLIVNNHTIVGKIENSAGADRSTLLENCIDAFRERIDYTIDAALPKHKSLEGIIADLTEQHSALLDSEESQLSLEQVREMVKASNNANESIGASSLIVTPSDNDLSFDVDSPVWDMLSSEIVHEQEKEREQEQEQEKEREEEVEKNVIEADTFRQNKFSRNDESPRAWLISDLCKANPSALRFFNASEFAMHRKLTTKPSPIVFPQLLHISSNHYNPAWSLSTNRRIKNVLVVMEWIPDSSQLRPASSLLDMNLKKSSETTEIVEKVFELFDIDGDGKLNREELFGAMTILDVPPEEEASMGIEGDNDALHANAIDKDESLLASRRMKLENILSRELQAALFDLLKREVDSSNPNFVIDKTTFKTLVHQHRFYRLQEGRNFVVLSLYEAEALRGLIHMRQRRSAPLVDGSSMSIALYNLSSRTYLDSTKGFQSVSEYQRTTMYETLRFINSEDEYSERSINLLLRSLQNSDREARKTWFQEVRECRRRSQRQLNLLPIYRLFTCSNEFAMLHERANIYRMSAEICRRGMNISDAFSAFDSDRNGFINCSELLGAFKWLGIKGITPHMIQRIMKNSDRDHDGVLSSKNFVEVFGDWYVQSVMQERGLVLYDKHSYVYEDIVIEPVAMPELYEDPKKRMETIAASNLKNSVVRNYRVDVKGVGRFRKEWTSQGALTKQNVSIWSLDPESSILKSNRLKASLGYYVQNGFVKPTHAKTSSFISNTDGKRSNAKFTLEIRDVERWGISGQGQFMLPVLNKFLPHPIRYTLVWKQEYGSPLYAWKPIPSKPSEYVALGMVCTTSEVPPSTSLVRCVPRSWCKESKLTPVLLWKDSGASGGRPGSIWIVNRLQTLWVVDGHNPPDSRELFDLRDTSFQLMDENKAQGNGNARKSIEKRKPSRLPKRHESQTSSKTSSEA